MPLLLAGVHEDVTAYRRLATNTCILETEIGGNIDFLSPSEIAILATEAALAHYQLCGELVLRTHREMRHRERTLTDPAAILDAARFQVQSIPYFVVFRNGQPALQRAGFTGRAEMRRWLTP